MHWIRQLWIDTEHGSVGREKCRCHRDRGRLGEAEVHWTCQSVLDVAADEPVQLERPGRGVHVVAADAIVQPVKPAGRQQFEFGEGDGARVLEGGEQRSCPAVGPSEWLAVPRDSVCLGLLDLLQRGGVDVDPAGDRELKVARLVDDGMS